MWWSHDLDLDLELQFFRNPYIRVLYLHTKFHKHSTTETIGKQWYVLNDKILNNSVKNCARHLIFVSQ